MPTGKPSSVKYISLVTPRVVLYIESLAIREASIQDMHSAGTVESRRHSYDIGGFYKLHVDMCDHCS